MAEITLDLTPPDLVGRILALNLSICRKFQCGGFAVTTSRPSAIVEPQAQQDQLRRALLDGRLVDVTGQNTEGLSLEGSEQTAPKESEDKGSKVYIQVDDKGNILVVAPKDEADEAAKEAELAEHGHLTVEGYTVADHPLATPAEVQPGMASELMDQIGTTLEKAKEKNYVPRMK